MMIIIIISVKMAACTDSVWRCSWVQSSQVDICIGRTLSHITHRSHSHSAGHSPGRTDL